MQADDLMWEKMSERIKHNKVNDCANMVDVLLDVW